MRSGEKWLFLFALLLSFHLFGQCGKVLEVKDGDTFVMLLPNERKLKVRVAYIDAPEHGQPYGAEAKLFATRLLLHQRVCVDVKYKDPYGRAVALVTLPNGEIANENLLKAGYAWHYTRYSKDRKLEAYEKQARLGKKGLWQSKKPQPPWIWRKEHHIGFKRR